MFDIGGAYKTLSGVATLSDTSKGTSAAVGFEIKGDGKSLWQSKSFRTRNDSQWFNVNVTGVTKLELIVHCPGTNDMAHTVWFEPFLIR